MSQVSSKISLQWLQPSVLLPMATAAGHASTLASSHILVESVKTRIASYPDLPTDSLMACARSYKRLEQLPIKSLHSGRAYARAANEPLTATVPSDSSEQDDRSKQD